MDEELLCTICKQYPAEFPCICGKEIQFLCGEHYQNHAEITNCNPQISIEQARKESVNNLSKCVVSLNKLYHDIEICQRNSAEDIEDYFTAIIAPYEQLSLEIGEKLRQMNEHKTNFSQETSRLLQDFDTEGLKGVLKNKLEFEEIQIEELSQKALNIIQNNLHKIPQDEFIHYG